MIQVDLKHVRDEVADRVSRAAMELGSVAENAAAGRRPPRRGRPSRLAVLAGAAAGALAVYFFDGERGRARRTQFADWSGARLRRGWRAVKRLGSRAASTGAAFPQRMVSLRSGPRPADDLTLRDRVESEVFRNADLPKGQINLDVESGVVTIRGQVENAFLIASVEKAVLNVPGVVGVENHLHVDGTPALNKARARENAG